MGKVGIIGQHDGTIFYTIGKRHGLDVGGGLPYYVVGKDMAKNEVYVTTQLDNERLWRKELKVTDLHWINEFPEPDKTYQVRTRYRAPFVDCHIEIKGDEATIKPSEEVRAITPGKSAVIYDGDPSTSSGQV